jgi:hypothetical protein
MKTANGITALLLLATVVSACAKQSGSSPGDEGPGNISGSLSPGPQAPNEPLLVTPAPGLRDVHPIHWTKVTAGADRRSLTVAFWSEPCFDVDHVGLAEEADRVVVTVYVGTSSSTGNQPCAQTAAYLGVRVPLSAPLAGRSVIDGAPATGQGTTGPGSYVSPSQP